MDASDFPGTDKASQKPGERLMDSWEVYSLFGGSQLKVGESSVFCVPTCSQLGNPTTVTVQPCSGGFSVDTPLTPFGDPISVYFNSSLSNIEVSIPGVIPNPVQCYTSQYFTYTPPTTDPTWFLLTNDGGWQDPDPFRLSATVPV